MDDYTSARGQTIAASQAQSQRAPKAYRRSPRFNYWLLFLLFSLIVVGSSIEASDRVHRDERSIANQKWAVGCSISSLAVALVVVALHWSPAGSLFIVGTRIEGGLSFIMTALWSALVAAISDIGNGLAVDQEGAVSYGNLYYFGWAGFVTAIVLFTNYLRNVHHVEMSQELQRRSDRLNIWIAMLTASLVLMSSAANVFDHSCDESRLGKKFCNRTVLAMMMGVLGTMLAIVVIGMKVATGVAPFGIEFFLSTVLFLSHCYILPLVTSEQGPGAKIGNLYYFSWISLLIPFVLVTSCYEHYAKARDEAEKLFMRMEDEERLQMEQEFGIGYDGMSQYYGGDGTSLS